MSLTLFVFGTLRRGERNHHYLHGFYDRVLPAVLTGYARVAPLMIAPCPGGEVIGELYFLTESRAARTLAECDELEELVPGTLVGKEYERRCVCVVADGVTVEAWAYVQSLLSLQSEF